MTLPGRHPFHAVEHAADIPPEVSSWASEWAALNVDMTEEGSFMSKHGPDALLPVPVNLYGGMTPVGEHVDEDRADRPCHPVWGLVLHSPRGELVLSPGAPEERRLPLGTGTAYSLDPRVPHEVRCPPGHIAFAATWGVDPAAAFGTLESFAIQALRLAVREHASEPDPVRVVEKAHGMNEGELS